MNTVLSMNNRPLRWQGVRLAIVSAILGSFVFVLADHLPLLEYKLSSLDIIGIVIFTIGISVISLPFSIVGGYALGWLLERTPWFEPSSAKVIATGVVIASLTLVVIFSIVSFLDLCLMSYRVCTQDFAVFIKQTVADRFSSGLLTNIGSLFVSRFIKSFLIAAICGSITAWRLSRVAQQKTA